ncbi:MAG: hypothetical protein HY360_18485 [Verrucomicrobia bacterium]|nr:hypothetical protein [Verrucomicrobiota bacterium]
MKVVDVDHDGEPVRPVTDHVVMPAAGKIADGVSADALVDELDFSRRIAGGDQVNGQFDVTISELRAWARRPAFVMLSPMKRMVLLFWERNFDISAVP